MPAPGWTSGRTAWPLLLGLHGALAIAWAWRVTPAEPLPVLPATESFLPPPAVPPLPVKRSRALSSTSDNAAPSLRIAREADGWHIRAQAVSRLEAAREFARLQGSELAGAIALLERARPLSLSWQGRDTATAWRLLLGDEVSYLLQCQPSRCRPIVVASDGPGPAVAAATPAAGAFGAPRLDNAHLAPPPRARLDPPDNDADVLTSRD